MADAMQFIILALIRPIVSPNDDGDLTIATYILKGGPEALARHGIPSDIATILVEIHRTSHTSYATIIEVRSLTEVPAS